MEPAPPLLPGGTSRELFLPRVEERRPDGAPTLSTFRNDPNAMESWPAGTGRMVSDDAGLVSLDVTSVQGDSSGLEPHSAEIGRAAADRLFFELVAEERGVPVLPRPLEEHAHRQEGRALRHWQAILPGRSDRSVYRCNDCSVQPLCDSGSISDIHPRRLRSRSSRR